MLAKNAMIAVAAVSVRWTIVCRLEKNAELPARLDLIAIGYGSW
jgi:hypothetical protein